MKANFTKRRIYFDSRCREWPTHVNGNTFSIDLRKPLVDIRGANLIQATIPVYSAAAWQEEDKTAAIRITGMYRRDVQQVLPMQMPSDVVATIPLATVFPGGFVYTFYQSSDDSGLWTSEDSKMSVSRVDRLEISLLAINGTSVVPYPLVDSGFAVSQNWSAVVEFLCVS